MSKIDVNCRKGIVEGLEDDLPPIKEDITLYDYEKHDLIYWVDDYDLACVKNLYDALSKESAEYMRGCHIKNGYTDVEVKIDHVFIGRMTYDQKKRFLTIPDVDRSNRSALERLFACDFVLQLTPVHYIGGDKTGAFDAEMMGRVSDDEIEDVAYYKQNRFCEPKLEFDRIGSISVYNDVGEVYMNFYSDVWKDETPKYLFTMSVPDICAVVYRCHYKDKDGKEDGCMSLMTWCVDKEDIREADEYLKKNWPKEMNDRRDY